MKPILKWAGGKRQIIDKLTSGMPIKYERYFEPFVGGGAMLFHLKPDKAEISDINCELINCYKVVKNNLYELIDSLKVFKNDVEYFYEVRSWDVSNNKPIQRAARLIYLNKTCFNGLYRENSKGKFNVPYGKYKSPKIIDDDNLKAVSEYFNKSEIGISCCSYTESIKNVKKGDFIYFDPPYHPLKSDSFTMYSKTGFSESDQKELAKTFKDLSNIGAYVMASNSNTEFINKLYDGFNKETLTANRAINSKGDGRKNKQEIEIIIRNWDAR